MGNRVFTQTQNTHDKYSETHDKQSYRHDKHKLERSRRRKRSNQNMNYFRTLLQVFENDFHIPEEILSKENVQGVTKMARKLVNFYDLISQTFMTIKMLLNVFSAFVGWLA